MGRAGTGGAGAEEEMPARGALGEVRRGCSPGCWIGGGGMAGTGLVEVFGVAIVPADRRLLSIWLSPSPVMGVVVADVEG